MKKLIKIFLYVYTLILFGNVSLWSGQNSSAGIRFDLNSSTTGNQNQISIGCPGTGTFVRVDVYVINASNLDTYEFNVNYNETLLQFISGSEDQPVTYETNFLKKNGGSTTGFTCTASSGVVNCANTLVGNQGDNTPDGEGVLASIVFKCLVDCPGYLTFGDVYWYDNDGVKDVCTNKGSDVSLPIELSSFEAETGNDYIMLKWITESEINNMGFELYRSNKELGNFILLSSYKTNEDLKGQGNSTHRSEYSYKDESIEAIQTYWYKLVAVDFDGKKTFYGLISVKYSYTIPEKFKFYHNFPNPFNSNTTLKYDIPLTDKGSVKVKVLIYNILGEVVKVLLEKETVAGTYEITWDGRGENGVIVPSGIYFAVFTSDFYNDSIKMILMK